MKKIWFSVFLAALIMVPAVWGAEMDNPSYQSWAKFKVGAMVRYAQASEMAGTKSESEIVYALVELTPEKAVVEMSGSTIVAGNKIEMPKTRMEHLAKVQGAPTAATAPALAGGKVDTKQGEEEIEAAGAKIKCKTVDSKIEQGESVINSKIWTSDDIPGTLVKSVNSMEKPMKTTTTLVLVEKKVP